MEEKPTPEEAKLEAEVKAEEAAVEKAIAEAEDELKRAARDTLTTDPTPNQPQQQQQRSQTQQVRGQAHLPYPPSVGGSSGTCGGRMLYLPIHPVEYKGLDGYDGGSEWWYYGDQHGLGKDHHVPTGYEGAWQAGGFRLSDERTGTGRWSTGSLCQKGIQIPPEGLLVCAHKEFEFEQSNTVCGRSPTNSGAAEGLHGDGKTGQIFVRPPS